jgi:hypothetical protein
MTPTKKEGETNKAREIYTYLKTRPKRSIDTKLERERRERERERERAQSHTINWQCSTVKVMHSHNHILLNAKTNFTYLSSKMNSEVKVVKVTYS